MVYVSLDKHYLFAYKRNVQFFNYK